MRHPAAAAIERYVRQLGVGDPDVHIFDDVASMPVDQSLRRALDHVDRGLVGRDVVTERGRAEHDVVTQFVGFGELGVVVGADRFAGQIAGDVEKAYSGLIHDITHLIHAGVTGRPLRWRYSAMVLRLFNSRPWPAPNRSQKSPTQPVRWAGAASGKGLPS